MVGDNLYNKMLSVRLLVNMHRQGGRKAFSFRLSALQFGEFCIDITVAREWSNEQIDHTLCTNNLVIYGYSWTSLSGLHLPAYAECAWQLSSLAPICGICHWTGYECKAGGRFRSICGNILPKKSQRSARLCKITVNVRIIWLNVSPDFRYLFGKRIRSSSALVMSSSRCQWILCLAASFSTARTV